MALSVALSGSGRPDAVQLNLDTVGKCYIKFNYQRFSVVKLNCTFYAPSLANFAGAKYLLNLVRSVLRSVPGTG